MRAARPGSRLEVLAGLGHFPHVESPTEVASAIEEFIAASQDAADTTQLSSQSRGPHRNLEVSEDSKSELRRLFDDLKSRKQIEVAVRGNHGVARIFVRRGGQRLCRCGPRNRY